jgi:hypothetical protein
MRENFILHIVKSHDTYIYCNRIGGVIVSVLIGGVIVSVLIGGVIVSVLIGGVIVSVLISGVIVSVLTIRLVFVASLLSM